MDVPRRNDADGSARVNAAGEEAPDIGVEPGIRVLANLPAEMTEVPSLQHRRVAWHPGSHDLLYPGAPTPADGPGPLTLLSLAQPGTPRPIWPGPIGTVAWRPDGDAFAFTGAELATGRGYVPIIAQVRVGRRPPGLMPPEALVRGTTYLIHRWLDLRTLAAAYPAIRSLWRLALLDTERRAPIPTPLLEASLFNWSLAGDRVAGQSFIWPDPPSFWLWDWRQSRFLRPPGPRGRQLPGASQFFEAWSPDGRSALFTAWEGTTYDPDAVPTLYQLDVETGAVTKVADNAAMAAWSGDWIAYVSWEPVFALTMTRARDRQALWTEELGLFPYESAEVLWDYRPRFAGPYVAYRNTPALWRISRADRKTAQPFYRGEPQDLTWSPDGQYIAFIHRNETARLLLLENPLGRPPS